MAEVLLTDVRKYYTPRGKNKKKGERILAVKDLNLKIADGEFLSLLGPSGCGKTTTLRMIVGLETVSEGEIFIGGKVVNDWTPAQRNVAMAFETYALYSHLSVRDNLGLCMKAKNTPASTIKEDVDRLAKALQITDLLDTYPSSLSGGQQQRVSLGRALIRNPSVTLLDEPLSHLDASLRLEMRLEIKRLHKRLKGTYVLVTHDQMEALAISDRVAVMNFAKLQQVGTPDDLYEKPVNLFVAGFVGEPPINIFKNATIKVRDDELYAVTAGGEYSFKLSKETKKNLEKKERKTISIGIRPQFLGINPLEGREALSGKISVFEFLGEMGHLTVSVDDLDLNLLTPPELQLEKGGETTVYYDPGKVLLFDSESGANIAYE